MKPAPRELDAEAEARRLHDDTNRVANWKRWGPYLSERQWGTVREDYSPGGDAWAYFPFEHSHLRAYRWGEDGLLGWCDRQARLCLSVALWNGKDPVLKERLFGLSGPEGNHGEDCKELYFFLDSAPTHSFTRMAYVYPQAEYPYDQLREQNARRSRLEPEFELEDTGVLETGVFDVVATYAKAAPDDTLWAVSVTNLGPRRAPCQVLAQAVFRNTWSWGRSGEGYGERPRVHLVDDSAVLEGGTLGRFRLFAEGADDWLFCENESNSERLWRAPGTPWPKDAFHRRVVHGEVGAVNPGREGTKVAAWFRLDLAPGETRILRLRLLPVVMAPADPFADFGAVVAAREAENEAFHRCHTPAGLSADESAVLRQARAGLLCSKQAYHYVVQQWLEGDPATPPPPGERRRGRNAEWAGHLYNRDVISMPDTWEYPWYAAWDLAFHAVPFARVDPDFAKGQVELFVREWYMHPNGQIPAYEWNFSDVNPPVHAWAAWRVYKLTAPRGKRDRRFLAHLFQKLLMNFTWWVNRKDEEGNNLFGGGFLGLDNIGVFDRSKPLPQGWALEQADGTAWMAFFCTTMLAIALELASTDPGFEDMASKFFEHFVAIADAMNAHGGRGLWDEDDGFYYDGLVTPGGPQPVRIRSMVGLVPLFAAEVIDEESIRAVPGFRKRLDWFLANRPELGGQLSYMAGRDGSVRRLLAIPSRERLVRVLRHVLDEEELLSPYGVRSLSKVHDRRPFELRVGNEIHRVAYAPAESDTGMFGGNSNWRGPVWFPLNWLLVEALDRYHYFYGDSLRVECPTGSGNMMTLEQVATELSRRLAALFLPAEGGRPAVGPHPLLGPGAPMHGRILFHEYFHGDTGRGLGASHQTGWTALVAECLRRAHRGQIG